MTTWRICPWCDPNGPDGNEWESSAFTAAGGGWPEEKRPCNSCFNQKYPKRRTNCADCGKRMNTRGECKRSVCRACRKIVRDANPPRVQKRRRCAHCNASVVTYADVEVVRCRPCKDNLAKLVRPKKRKKARKPKPIPLKGKDISFEGFTFSRKKAA